MAELVIAVANRQGYESGDIVEAFSTERILWKAIQLIVADNTKPWFYKLSTDLHYHMLNATMEYRFEATTKTEAVRTTLADSSTTQVPMDVTDYVDRTEKIKDRVIFEGGDTNIWFGGRTILSLSKLEDLWNTYIAPATGASLSSAKQRTQSVRESKRFLTVVCSEFDATRSRELTEDDLPTRKRKRTIDWESLSWLSAQDIANIKDIDTQFVTNRNEVVDQGTLVTVKP